MTDDQRVQIEEFGGRSLEIDLVGIESLIGYGARAGQHDHRTACDAIPADISRDPLIDAGYLSKMFNGQKMHPSRDVVIRLAAFGLHLGMADSDELLMAATFRPLAPACYWK